MPTITAIHQSASQATERNLKRGYQPLVALSVDQYRRGEEARDVLLTRMEVYIHAQREAAAWASLNGESERSQALYNLVSWAEQQSKRLRIGKAKQWASWWLKRQETKAFTLLENA